MAQGLFVANPDSSEDEGVSPGSPARASPLTASSSSSGKGSMPIATQPSSQTGSPLTGTSGFSIPTIPAPQSSPLPLARSLPSSQQSVPHPSFSAPLPEAPLVTPSNPPQPPPQPERHSRRAFTIPTPEPSHRLGLVGRTGGGSFRERSTHSPPRALPPLPSATSTSVSTARQSETPSGNPSNLPSYATPPFPSDSYPPAGMPASTASQANTDTWPYMQRLSTYGRTASPEDTINSATISDKSFATTVLTIPSSRTASTFLQNQKVLLQVTTDNEQFTLVDISGMQTAEAIRERVFSKVSRNAAEGC